MPPTKKAPAKSALSDPDLVLIASHDHALAPLNRAECMLNRNLARLIKNE